jgi:hypothetical protein
VLGTYLTDTVDAGKITVDAQAVTVTGEHNDGETTDDVVVKVVEPEVVVVVKVVEDEEAVVAIHVQALEYLDAG